jgi:hypothetical protein
VYAYAGNSPWMNVDPEGLDWVDAMGGYYPDGGKSGNYPGSDHNPLENMCSTVIMMAGPAAVAVGTEAGIAIGVRVTVRSVIRFFKDESGALGGHTKGARESTRGKHEKGDARRGKDRGGEKADKRRKWPSTRPSKWKGPWPPK